MTANSITPELKNCPFCGGDCSNMEKNRSIFLGQNYHDRYPKEVAEQNNGYKVRCEICGAQTCWWHYEWEAISSWNHRA